MTDPEGDRVLQYPTHAELIEATSLPEPSAATTLDAIIVPAARPAKNLQTAAELATETGARLIVLCSFRAHVDDVRALLSEHELHEPAVVEMPAERDDWILSDFETTRWVHGAGKGVCGIRNSDLSRKRNTGLLLARMLGWERIFFLDDDIRAVSAETVLSTVSLLGADGHGYRTAAMSVQDYPDNSVVCHARRAVGAYQDVFVSGSALAVDCGVPFGFFPDLYNEDWLFFYRDAAEERLATPGSLAEQLPYDPFADPQRAAGQEFGNVIAEGLYALLHSSLGIEAADEKYWKQFLKQRNTVLDDVSRHLPALPPGPRGEMSKSIGAAQQVLWAITPTMCVDYLAAWQRDLGRWERLLANLPRVSSVQDALRIVGLPDARSFVMPSGSGSGSKPPMQKEQASELLASGTPPAADIPAKGVPVIAGSSGVQVGDNNTQNNFYFYGPGTGESPGQGLVGQERSAYESDSELFPGGDEFVSEIMARLSATASGIVVVSGTAGAGKSSLLRAGILPHLRQDGLPGKPNARTWPCLLFTPGAALLDELAAQVAAVAGISAGEVSRSLAADPGRLGLLARQAVLGRQVLGQVDADPTARPRVVLLIDQFEQVFTLCRSETERRTFISALESAAASPEASVLALLAVRDDYADRCAEYPQLADATRDRYRLPRITRPEPEPASLEPAPFAGDARVLVGTEEREGEQIIVVTGPDGLRSERQVSWLGGRLPVPKAFEGTAVDLETLPGADLAEAVEQGLATEAMVREYGRLLFDAAFGQDLWGQLLQAATGQPYLEIAIRGAGGNDQEAMQALRWEALHDGSGFLALPGAEDFGPVVSIVRLVGGGEQSTGSGVRSEFPPMERIPRVLFVVGGSLDDSVIHADREIRRVMDLAGRAEGWILPRVLEQGSLESLVEELRAFRPDVLHLIGQDARSIGGQVALALRLLSSASPATEWVTAKRLLGAFGEAAHVPELVILSAGRTASAGTSSAPRSSGAYPGPVPPRSMAADLAAGGVPVVIAMAGDISNTACIAFTAELIAALAGGLPLARAVSAGRQASLAAPASGFIQWDLPTAFLGAHVRSEMPIVEPGVASAVRERISLLGLDHESQLFSRGAFAAAMDRLLDGRDPFNVLFCYRSAGNRDYDDYRLLRELGAHAVRSGVLPILLGPYDRDPPSRLFHLASEIAKAIDNLRTILSLGRGSTRLLTVAAQPNATLEDLAQAARMDLATLVEDLTDTDQIRAPNDYPRVLLLCHAVDTWLGAADGLLDLLGPMGLAPGPTPIPVVLTGIDTGVLREAHHVRWPGRPWIRAIPLERVPEEEHGFRDSYQPDAETKDIRALVAAMDYQAAEERLASLMAVDPAHARELRLELGFLTLPEPDRRVIATAWRAASAERDVQSLLAEDDASRPPTAPVPVPAPAPPQPAVTAAPRRNAQQSGAALELATGDLFARFFAVDRNAILGRLRRQKAGTQFGHDIEIECTVAGNPTVRCHVECKNAGHEPTLGEIAGKLLQQKLYYKDAPIDHWILISPRHDVANDLRRALGIWERQGDFPFSVQVWSPENRVREMFALEPMVYEAVYGHPPAADETRASDEVMELIRQRLSPRLRVEAVWRRYLEQPGSFCFVNEDHQHLDELYKLNLPLKAADEGGRVLNGTLMDQVIGWATGEGTEPMLLLADFGEGKSVFTYCLARHLAEDFRAAPDRALFPLRIPLRNFHKAQSAQELLKHRLDEINASLGQWRALTRQARTLVILDGFDEMSTDLSPAAVTVNLRDIRACIEQFSGSKVLVTSRQRVLDGSRDWKRTLDRLGKPQVMRIAPGSRRQRLEYLAHFATDEASASMLAKLRGLYDPIGLAAKPLFLEMIKDTLRDLPDDTFSETILYDTYIDRSLRRKAEFLLDPEELLITDELVENLENLLEDVAVRLQETDASYVYLRDYQGRGGEKLAELLWRMRDQPAPRGAFALSAQDDAASRVGIRSLLKAVLKEDSEGDRWPVDFFHRSMREYFVARSLVHSLTADPERVRQLLTPTPLLPEIAHFAAAILRSRPDDSDLAALERLARSATEPGGYLGGNALTLLHGAGGVLTRRNWSGLHLDYARLRGADLHRTRFAGCSLRHANLDNANLEDADLTGADLEGVRLEETRQVLAVTALDGKRILAAYEDQSLREWRARPGSDWESEVIAMLQHKTQRLQVTPLGRVMAFGEGMLTVLDLARNGDAPADSDESDRATRRGEAGEAAGPTSIRCAFRTSSQCRTAVLGSRTALFTEERDNGRIEISLLDVASSRVLNALDSGDGVITASAQVDGELFAIATAEAINVFWPDEEGQYKGAILVLPAVTCLAVRADGRDVLVAAGHQDGSVSLTSLRTDTGVTGPPWQRQLHDGPVTGILLDAEDQVVTGSTDRSVCVFPASALRPDSDLPGSSVQRLHLTLRCKGVRYKGVRTEREQEKLRQYAEY